MALSVDYVYGFTRNLIHKNQAGGLGSIDFAYKWNDAQCSYQDDLLGRFQRASNGKTGLNTGLIEDETIMQKLTPFIDNVTLGIASGLSDKPSNFIYRLAMRINGEDCYKINHGQIATVNDSVIDPPSIANDRYYFIEYLGFYSFLPNTVTFASLDYIITPALVVWNYDFDVDGRQVYNPVGSVQPVWDSSSCMEITKRMLKTMGVSFKDNDFVNFGQSVINAGE